MEGGEKRKPGEEYEKSEGGKKKTKKEKRRENEKKKRKITKDTLPRRKADSGRLYKK